MNAADTQSTKRLLSDETVIYTCFVSVFLPYYITALVICATALYLFVNKRLNGIFQPQGTAWSIAFCCYALLVALANLNFIGICCAFGCLIMTALSLYCRKTFTVHSFERALDLCCYCSVPVCLFTFIEYFVHAFRPGFKGQYRCQLYFFNSNYLATILATVIIICGYKVITAHKRHLLYYSVSVLCAIGMYLTGSMFVWVEVLMGVAALLMITRQHQMLSILLLLAGTACIVLYCAPELIPRLYESNITTDNRVMIWKTSLAAIKDFPLFGRGFLTYYHIYQNFPGSYPTTHAHNILLEPILSFGIIGTAILIVFFVYYYKRVTTCHNAQSKLNATSLILSLTCAILIHATTDLTFLWIQTGFLYALIMGGVGIEERLLKIG